MKQIWMAQLLVMAFACSPKKPIPQPESVSVEAQYDDTDCTSGVKNDCNVPKINQAQIDTINAANKKCFEACVFARQMEAIGHEVIEEQCKQGCDEQHFVGQVQIAPTLENTPPHLSAEPVPMSPEETDD